jgi:hypothetical protein
MVTIIMGIKTLITEIWGRLRAEGKSSMRQRDGLTLVAHDISAPVYQVTVNNYHINVPLPPEGLPMPHVEELVRDVALPAPQRGTGETPRDSLA